VTWGSNHRPPSKLSPSSRRSLFHSSIQKGSQVALERLFSKRLSVRCEPALEILESNPVLDFRLLDGDRNRRVLMNSVDPIVLTKNVQSASYSFVQTAGRDFDGTFDPSRPYRSGRMRLNDRDRGARRHHVAPQIRGGGIAVLKDDRCALTFIDTGHSPAFDFEKFLWCKWLAAVAHCLRCSVFVVRFERKALEIFTPIKDVRPVLILLSVNPTNQVLTLTCFHGYLRRSAC
jgi:hypothetical protein